MQNNNWSKWHVIGLFQCVTTGKCVCVLLVSEGDVSREDRQIISLMKPESAYAA